MENTHTKTLKEKIKEAEDFLNSVNKENQKIKEAQEIIKEAKDKALKDAETAKHQEIKEIKQQLLEIKRVRLKKLLDLNFIYIIDKVFQYNKRNYAISKNSDMIKDIFKAQTLYNFESMNPHNKELFLRFRVYDEEEHLLESALNRYKLEYDKAGRLKEFMNI